tara:strand:- start:125 stop:856 length:732 start_codon:yes stop_codon:yes gene_type:complete
VSRLDLFTAEEALNVRSIHSGKWKVHPVRSWFDKDPSDVKTTGFLDVSNIGLMSVQCGDVMCIAFNERQNNIVNDGTFDTDTAASTTGTYWTTQADWTISDGKATKVAGSGGKSITQTSLLTIGTSYQVTYDLDLQAGRFQTVCGDLDCGDLRYTSGTYTEYVVPTGSNTSFRFWGSYDFAGSVDNVIIRPLTQINKSTDFAIVAGQYQLQVPRGIGDNIIFSYLPHREPTNKQELFMRIVEH